MKTLEFRKTGSGERKRIRLAALPGILWISGFGIAAVGFAYEAIVVEGFSDGGGIPYAYELPIVPGILVFSTGMVVFLAGVVLQRYLVSPSVAGQRLLWASAWVCWFGALLAGIGFTYVSFSPIWMTQGTFILAMMMLAGAVVLIIGEIFLAAGIARLSITIASATPESSTYKRERFKAIAAAVVVAVFFWLIVTIGNIV